MVAAAGSFASISTLLGSPLVGAFLLMEASGLGGATMELVLLPGLLAAGVGSLIFIGLGAWSGLGTFSLAIPNLPKAGHPDVAQFLWALAIGVLAVLLAWGPLAPAGTATGPGRGRGHRGHVGGDAQPPADLRPAGFPATRHGRR